MTQENAWRIMYNCMIKTVENNTIKSNSDREVNVFTIPSRTKDVQRYLSYIFNMYENEIADGCAKDVGYIININRLCNTHPINILVTILLLLVADAKIYLLYDDSYRDLDSRLSMLNTFLDEFLNTYEKAEKIIVTEEMTFKTGVVLENFIKQHEDIRHIVEFGDFVNFYPNKRLLEDLDIQLHLPAAHYVIVNYSSPNISARDKQVLHSFGPKCFEEYIDYSGYKSSDNKYQDFYGFDVCVFNSDLALFNTIKDVKDHIDKIVTVIFTDKDKSALNYPEEFYDCMDVHFSKNYNDNILNYDFKQLFK